MNKLLLGTIVTATFAAAAVPLAFADRDGSHGHHFAHWQKDGRKASLPSQRVEERLTKLKSELKITEAQEAQWKAFAGTQRKHALEADKRMEAFRAQRAEDKERPRFNAVERMERQQARMAEMSVRMSETLAALKPLYAALTPEQQKAFDEMRGPRGRHGSHHRRGGHEHGERGMS
ncbi:MAG: Spy/CpxP family protein refolding chaperone [Betaproteobacteria bacterium]|nr:Spy/CpxP family protein refolding chaperone [Betaproteobacteria bacterium]